VKALDVGQKDAPLGEDRHGGEAEVVVAGEVEEHEEGVAEVETADWTPAVVALQSWAFVLF
jgi:hypothetical protein